MVMVCAIINRTLILEFKHTSSGLFDMTAQI